MAQLVSGIFLPKHAGIDGETRFMATDTVWSCNTWDCDGLAKKKETRGGVKAWRLPLVYSCFTKHHARVLG